MDHNFKVEPSVSDEDLDRLFSGNNPESQDMPIDGDNQEIVNDELDTVEDKDKEEPAKDVDESEKEKSEKDEKEVDALYTKLGLQKQFPGGATQAISAIPDFNRYIDTLNKTVSRMGQQNQILMDKIVELQGGNGVKVDPNALADEFAVDPVNATVNTVDKAGFVKKDKVEALEKRLEAQDEKLSQQDLQIQGMNVIYVMDDIPELKPVAAAFRLQEVPSPGVNLYFDAMRAEYASDFDSDTETHHEYQGPLYMNIRKLYSKIKPDVDKIMAFNNNKGVKPPVTKLPAGQKENANTSGASGVKGDKPKAGATTGKEPDFSKMSRQEIRKYLDKVSPPTSE